MRLETLVGIVGVGILTYYVYKKLLSEPDQPAKPADKTKTNTDADKKKMGCLESKPEEEGAPQQKKAKVESTSAAPATVNSTAAAKPAANAAKPAAATAGASTAAKPAAQEFSWNKKKPDPKDFMFSNRKNEVLIKEPGKINGQMFIIEDCEDCDIYICDHTAQVQVDYNKRCRIFIAPVESSIFIRNCEDCKCIFACQQLRTRECKDCDFLLYASTAPVIEESKNMRFGCFRFFYFALASQFEKTKMSVYDNKWSEIYDFTPADGNWSFLPINTKASDLMKPLSAHPDSFSTAEEEAQNPDDSVVPVTAGLRKGDFAGQERAFILILPSKTADGPSLFSKLPETCTLIQTKQLQLDAGKIKNLLSKCDDDAIKATAKGMGVGVEVAGEGAIGGAKAAVAASGGSAVAYSSAGAEAAAYEVDVFFNQWRDFTGHGITK